MGKGKNSNRWFSEIFWRRPLFQRGIHCY